MSLSKNKDSKAGDEGRLVVHLNYLDTEAFTAKDSRGLPIKPGEYYGYIPSGKESSCGTLMSESNGAKATRKVVIQDVRALKHPDIPRLDTTGFELFMDNLGSLAGSVYDTSTNSEAYVMEMEKFLKVSVETRLRVKVKMVAIFDLQKRNIGSLNRLSTFDIMGLDQPLSYIHTDYNNMSGVERLRQLATASQNADFLAPVNFQPLQSRFRKEGDLEDYMNRKCRFLIVNIWRNGDSSGLPISRDPLAVCDPRTVPKESLVEYEVRCPEGLSLYDYHISGGKGDIDCASHGWYFYSKMKLDECLMWISHDSFGEFSSVPHTAFALPNQGLVGIRKSIETRAFVFLD